MDVYRHVTMYVNKHNIIDLIEHSAIDLQRYRAPYL